jgi:quercetin dioxygenase-like cupin family protein
MQFMRRSACPQKRARRGRHPVAIAGAISVFLALAIGGVSAETLTPVFQQALPNVGGKAFSAVTVDFAPASRSVPHRHGQAFVYAYVLSGTVRSQVEGQPAQTFMTGQGWHEDPGSHHVLTENPSATEPARLLVIFVADTGAALKTDDSPTDAK